MTERSRSRTAHIIPNQYRDSVTLMQLSSTLMGLEGIDQASVVVASSGNLDLLRGSGLLQGEIEATASDIVIAIEGWSDLLDGAVARAEELLFEAKEKIDSNGSEAVAVRSISAGMAADPGANLALISTPGDYAAAEARKAVALGLDVMIFSDNVTEDDEISLKQFASKRGRLVMGPDCGTAIINGIPLAFANVVRRGPIGVVAASGTGLQQVTSLIDRYGSGVSQAIGTGGRDLHANVGGVTMFAALRALESDPATEIVVLVSKPPAPSIAKRVVEAAERATKPVVVNFLGPLAATERLGGVQFVRTLEEASRAAVSLAIGSPFESGVRPPDELLSRTRLAVSRGVAGGFVRGLYSGGTFCYEALILIAERIGEVYSNTPVDEAYRLENVWKSRGHCVVDLGDDEFTRGRPHPMIDHSIRNERIVAEAKDPAVGIVLFDVVLGHGSHADPAGAMIPALESANRASCDRVVFIGSVCGTDADPQNRRDQERRLESAGVILADSNAQAAMLAAEAILASGGGGGEEGRRVPLGGAAKGVV